MNAVGRDTVEVVIEDRSLRLSNLDKVLYPLPGFTKGQVIDYYTRIAPALLAHLGGRPLTLKRYPNGVDGSFFYEKNCPSHRPDWMTTVTVPSRGRGSGGNGHVSYCVVEELAGVVWVANLAALELHTSLSMAHDLATPTAVVFDLDPGAPADAVDCARVALLLRELVGELGLSAWTKTSGSKGLQVYLPLNTPVSYEQTKSFALAVARLLEDRHPGQVLSSMNKEQRRGKVFIDWSQNDRAKTTVCAYSLRAMDQPTVSTPLLWEEVQTMADSGRPLVVEATQALGRLVDHGDLFSPVARLTQTLPAIGDS